MTAHQRIVRVRRNYNQWVANQTLEDYALRFTAKSARRWSSLRVANTAIGAISFLALEAIGGAVTLNYGFVNATSAILAVGALIFLTGLPIAYYAATYGVDIDLLTRGAGFGYIGSTITSLIYASFTFLFFAIEAAIMSLALELWFGIPLPIDYVISSLVVIPLVTHGITFISRLQLWTQPIWLILHVLPFGFIAVYDANSFEGWTHFDGERRRGRAILQPASVRRRLDGGLLAVAQIGEQVDFLRFLPARRPLKHLVDRLSRGRPRLDRSRPAEAARGLVPGLSRDQPPGAGREGCRADADVSGGVPGCVFLAATRARLRLHLRHRLADQDQRHQCLCGLDRLVELLLAPHPQPSGPRRLAGLQRRDRAAADGARDLQGAGAHSRALFDRRGGLGRRAGFRPRRSTSRSD